MIFLEPDSVAACVCTVEHPNSSLLSLSVLWTSLGARASQLAVQI